MVSTVLYVLGCESSGKTSLIHQLEAMSRGFVEMQPLKTFPTAGQSVTTCTLKKPLHAERRNVSVLRNPLHKSGSHRTDREQAGTAEVEVEIRELGGSMEPHWEKFLQSSSKLEEKGNEGVRNGGSETPIRYALMYVIDAVAIHQLCEASVHFLRLTQCPGECKAWPTLVVLHKCSAPNATSVKDLRLFFGDASSRTIQIIEVDAWTGYGLGDAFNWIQNIAV